MPGRSVRSGPVDFDVYTALLGHRAVFVRGRLDRAAGNSAAAQLLMLAQADAQRPIELYVDSADGELTAALGVYDVMRSLSAPVSTTCLGRAAGPSVVVVAGGAAGQRFALPSARFSLRLPAASLDQALPAEQLQVHAREARRLHARLAEVLSQDTGRSIEQVAHDLDHGEWMSAAEAQAYGLVDAVVQRRPPAEDPLLSP